MAAMTSLRVELLRSGPKNSDNTPRLMESVKAMTSDPLDTGSLDVRRAVLGPLGLVAFFKFLASIIALSKMRRSWRAQFSSTRRLADPHRDSRTQPHNCKPDAMRESQSALAAIDNVPSL